MIKKLLLILFLLTSIVVSAQKEYTFSLEEAINFALLNNKSSINAKKDLAIAQKEKWETISRGLPQINSYFDFNNRLKDPISLIPAEFFGGKKGEFAEVSFGTKQSVSGELILNQLL
ncbi:MAG: TolC family protein, partial [Bacteroidota bacterium]|nr:TolC family protein [Bacteroidota bacterium]